MNLTADMDSVPVDKAVDSSSLYVIFQADFTELYIDEIERSIWFEPSTT